MNAPAVGVAVVGTGFGARVHVPALRAAGFEVRALVGRDAERTSRRAERLGVPHAVTSLAAALDTGVVAVTIATPPATHLPLALEALAAGRHVLCEKPFALDAAQARRVRDAALKAGVVAIVGHEFRFAATHVAIARVLADGVIGEPAQAVVISHVALLRDTTLRMPEWWTDAAQGGGWLAASGSHSVDTLRTWLGEVESVSGALQPLPGTSVDAGFSVRLRFASGTEAVLQESALAAGTPYSLMRISGTDGTISMHGGSVTIAAPDERVLLAHDATLGDQPSNNAAHRFTHLELGPYTELAVAFRAAIAGEAPPNPAHPATFDDGVACIAVLDAVRASAANDGAVVRIR